MAVPEQTPYIERTGNGVTTSFSLGFQCESKDHLIVLVDEIEPPIATWSLIGGNVVFTTAPAAGKKITAQRNTPFSRNVDYQSYNNSFRPPAVNKDFDWIWWKLQELGVADWILGARIDALKNYVDRKDDELKAYLMEEIRKQGVALDQLDEYYNYLMQRLAQIAVDKGWDASFVVYHGITQKTINDGLRSISEMLAIQKPTSGMRVYVKSYHEGLARGGGEFTYEASLSTVNDGGFILNGWVRQDATDLNVTRFGARLDGVNDDTGAFKLAIAKAKANGGGRIVYFGKPIISDQLTIDFDNCIAEGLDYAKITTAFTSSSTLLTNGDGCLFAVYKNWGTNFANNIKRPIFKNINITRKDGSVKCIALMLSGVRYATVENMWSEYNRATVYLENVSECTFINTTTQGSDYGIVLDSRYNRTSLLGFAFAETDVSNNTFIQTNIGWPQTAGIVNLGARQNRFYGAWIGHWGQSVLSSEFNNIPSVAAGVNITGDNVSITQSNIFDGFIFEPDRDRTVDCFVLQHRTTASVIQSNTVSNSYVQLYSRDLTRPSHFVRFDLLQSNYNNRMASLVFENCGYYGGNSDGTISNTQYPPFSRVTGVGTAEPNGVIYRNINPMTCLNLCPILGSRIDGSNALANVNITASNFLSDVVTTTEVKSGATVVGSFNTTLAKDWTLDAASGGTATLAPNTGNAGTPAAVRLTGSTSKIFISKKFGGESIRSIRNQIGYVYVKFSYTGNTPPICEFIVNDASDTDSSVVNAANRTRYGNAQVQESANSGNRMFLFRPFSANFNFTNFTVKLGRSANADSSAYTDISNLEIGWIAGNQTTYDPKA